MKHVLMGGNCVLLVADTKHSTTEVIDFMRGEYEKEIQIVIKRWRFVT